jgi:hypothetical protein
MKAIFSALVFAFLATTLTTFAEEPKAEEKPTAEARKIALADGKIELVAPEKWQKKQPRTRIVEFEFAAPASEGDKIDGRLTVMGAAGGVDANIARWVGQFVQPDGKATSDVMKSEEIEAGGAKIRLVDLKGTYKDQAGPMAPATMRDNYRMLGAIVITDDLGHYFLKFYGPEKTIGDHEAAFREMLGTLKVNK